MALASVILHIHYISSVYYTFCTLHIHYISTVYYTFYTYVWITIILVRQGSVRPDYSPSSGVCVYICIWLYIYIWLNTYMTQGSCTLHRLRPCSYLLHIRELHRYSLKLHIAHCTYTCIYSHTFIHTHIHVYVPGTYRREQDPSKTRFLYIAIAYTCTYAHAQTHARTHTHSRDR